MNFLKKTIACALSVFCAALVGCGGGTVSGSETPGESGSAPEMQKETMPDYLETAGKEKFTIGMWVGIPEYKTCTDEFGRVLRTEAWTDEEFDAQYKMIADAGFTLASTPNGLFSSEHIVRLCEAAEKYGLGQLVWDTELNKILFDSTLTDEEAAVKIRRAVVDYADYDSFYGNMITDEPNASEFPRLAEAARRYKTALPDKMFYLNLFPVYATNLQTGCDDYEEYLRQYETLELDYVCHDNYPLKKGPGNTTVLKDDFLYNMQLCNNMKSKPKTWSFLQAMGFGSMKEPDCEADLRLQLNCALAYGQKAIQWFCYFSPGYGGSENFTPAIIALDGTPTAKYDYVKTVNNEIAAWGDVYMRFSLQKTMNFIGSDNAKGSNAAFNYYKTDNSHARIRSFSCRKDAIAGAFKDEEGRDGFMVVNYDAPSSEETNRIEISFNNCTKAIVIGRDGKKTVTEPQNGKLTLDLKASEGAFVIPLYL